MNNVRQILGAGKHARSRPALVFSSFADAPDTCSTVSASHTGADQYKAFAAKRFEKISRIGDDRTGSAKSQVDDYNRP